MKTIDSVVDFGHTKLSQVEIRDRWFFNEDIFDDRKLIREYAFFGKKKQRRLSHLSRSTNEHRSSHHSGSSLFFSLSIAS